MVKKKNKSHLGSWNQRILTFFSLKNHSNWFKVCSFWEEKDLHWLTDSSYLHISYKYKKLGWDFMQIFMGVYKSQWRSMSSMIFIHYVHHLQTVFWDPILLWEQLAWLWKDEHFWVCISSLLLFIKINHIVPL